MEGCKEIKVNCKICNSWISTVIVDSDDRVVYRTTSSDFVDDCCICRSCIENGKVFAKTFKNEYYSAYTLPTNVIGKHDNGWEIDAEIQEDYYEWVSYFKARKGSMWVKGDFEKTVYASSEEAYNDFRKYFNPEAWDYDDI